MSMLEEQHADVSEQLEAKIALLTEQLVHQENKLKSTVEQKNVEIAQTTKQFEAKIVVYTDKLNELQEQHDTYVSELIEQKDLSRRQNEVKVVLMLPKFGCKF